MVAGNRNVPVFVAMDGFKVGVVESTEALPGKAKLTRCLVTVGAEQSVSVVTNASNVIEGSRVVVATVGSMVNGEIVKKACVGGCTSEGMLCDGPMLGWKGGGVGAAALVPDTFAVGDAPPEERPRKDGGASGDETSANGQVMPGKEPEPLFKMKEKLSKEDKKALAAAKKAGRDAKKADKKGGKKDGEGGEGVEGVEGAKPIEEEVEALAGKASALKLTREQERVAASRAVTGVLASSATAWDVKFDSFSVAVGGNQLVSDCSLELTQGCRYGLVGDNGSGKSNVLAAIAQVLTCPGREGGGAT